MDARFKYSGMTKKEIMESIFYNMTSIYPELVLGLTALLLIIFGALPSSKDAFKSKSPGLALGALALAIFFAFLQWGGDYSVFDGSQKIDHLSVFFKILCLTSAVFVVIFSQKSADLRPAGCNMATSHSFGVKDAPEYYALIAGLCLGMCLVVQSQNLLMIYLAIEFMSLMSYLLVAYAPASARSSEAGLKYLLFGAVASGVFLFGASYFYGITGSLDLAAVSGLAGKTQFGLGPILAGLLLLSGFLFKIAAVPMQAWCPDAYEGAPTAIAAFLSVAPKAAGFAVLIRVAGLMGEFADWPTIIAVISAVTMTFGNLSAIPQTNLKRLFAYSSIAHAGYILMGIAAFSAKGVESVAFYLIAYAIMNLGAFLVVLIVANESGDETIGAYSGLARRGRAGMVLAVAMMIFLLSLVGIPPFVGFVGKFYLFMAVLDSNLVWLAVVGVINSVISLYYYMRIAREMFFTESVTAIPLEIKGRRLYACLALLAVATTVLGVVWGFATPVVELVGK